MTIRITAALIVLACLVAPISAGYYSTFDAPEETQRWSRDFAVFNNVLTTLAAIPTRQPEVSPPIRNRYVLMETLGAEGGLTLKTLEAKLNFSAVLIRRNKADEAVQLLLPMLDEYPRDFLVHSHCATAHFLSTSNDFKAKAPFYMKKTLEYWPKRWEDVKEDKRKYLMAMGWETLFDRYRRCEESLERLIKNRMAEEKLRANKQPVPEVVDPIFVDNEGKPVRFVNDAGVFQVGRIPQSEFDMLPRDDAVEIVEQLLIWMPNDPRLLWLLGEVFNASAMGYKDEKRQHAAIRSAFGVFYKLNDLQNSPTFGLKEIREHYASLKNAVDQLPPERGFDPTKFGLDPDKDVETPSYRPMVIGFITGFAVGLFALWQFQEMRRRRLARK